MIKASAIDASYGPSDRKPWFWKLRLLRLRRPADEHGLKFGFLFRFLTACLAVIVPLVILLFWGLLNHWQLTDAMIGFFGLIIFLMTAIGEHLRSRVFERTIGIGGDKNIDIEFRLSSLPKVVNSDSDRKSRIVRSSAHEGGESSSGYSKVFLKRGIDIFMSLGGMIFLSPLLVLIAALIKFESEGPVLYTKHWVGPNGKDVRLFNFRSLAIGSLRESGPVVTRTGRFLRATNIDVLPELYNVLKGDMSMVGPRPVPSAIYYEHKDQFISLRRKSKDIKPGITGWAQVNGFRDRSVRRDILEERLKFDIFYVDHWSLWFDIKIIVMTIFSQRG